MKIPFKPGLLKIRRKSPKWIIIHHTSEIYEAPESRVDNNKFQMPGIASGVLENKHLDINYHYIIDKIQDDYMPIACRPFVYMCEWDDIPNDINNAAIHVALMGNYNFKIPEKRCYEVLAYRLINPMLKMFGLAPNKIKTHSDVSDNSDLECPGDFFDMERLITDVRRFVIK